MNSYLGGGKTAVAYAAACRPVALRAAAALTTAGVGATETAFPNTDGFRSAEFQLNVTAAATEAGDTLDVYIDTTYDDGATWVNVVHFPQVLGNGGAKKFVAHVGTTNPGAAPVDVAADAAVNVVRNLMLGSQVRVRHTSVDVATTSNMSFTFSVWGLFRS